MAAETIDWPTVATAAAVFISTVWLAYKGWRDAQKNPPVEGDTKILSAAIQDTASMRNNTEALRENTEEIRALRAALTRLTDMMLIISQRN